MRIEKLEQLHSKNYDINCTKMAKKNNRYPKIRFLSIYIMFIQINNKILQLSGCFVISSTSRDVLFCRGFQVVFPGKLRGRTQMTRQARGRVAVI